MRLIWVLDALLPVPRCNWPVADLAGHRLGTPDLLCDELAVAGEYDGAEHRKMARHARDVARESILRDAGLETFAVVGADVHRPGVVVERMQAAVRRAAESRRPRQWMIAVNPPLPSLTRSQ